MHESRFSLLFRSISLLFVFAFSGAGLTCVAEDTPITDRDIALTVVSADGSPVAVAANCPCLELRAAKVVVKSGESVKELLKANGIFPDTEAFGLVYDLNPTLRSIDPITSGAELTLPRVKVSGSQTDLASGQLVALRVDANLKNELLGKIDALDNVITTVSGFGVEHFHDANERTATLGLLRDINDSLTAIGNVIMGKVRPINNEVLKQVKAEAELLQPTLERLIQPGSKPTAEALDTIKLVDEDLRIKRRTLTDIRGPNDPPTRWREVLVVVKTLSQQGQPVSNLRVYYVPEALRRNAQFIRSFDTLSSPTQHSLPEANYVIWAGRPGQETEAAALSDVKKLKLRKTSDAPLPVDLAIIR